jgi:hypothetical protein
MEQTGPKKLKLGDPIDGTVVKPIGGRRFAVKCKGVPNGWKVELHTRRPELIRSGDLGTFWVAKISPYQGAILLHDGDFGKLPISDAMRQRYIAGLDAVLTGVDMTGEKLTDAHSMLMRIERKDQVDWLSVWRTLGEPESGDVKQMLAGIAALREARKQDPRALDERREMLLSQYGPIFTETRDRLAKIRSND